MGAHDDVHREPVQPRPERARAAKRADLPPGSNEYVLGQFDRPSWVAGQTQTEGVHPVYMLPVERFECLVVARLGPTHQETVIARIDGLGLQSRPRR